MNAGWWVQVSDKIQVSGKTSNSLLVIEPDTNIYTSNLISK